MRSEAPLLPHTDLDSDPPVPPALPATAAPAAARASWLTAGLIWWVILGVIVLDQVTKALVWNSLPLYASMPVVPGFIDLVHVHNRGVAFGLLNDVAHPQRGVLTTGLAAVALAGIAYYARHVQAHERLAKIGLSLILGGAVGNLADRIRQGFVVDFVDVYWGDWHFWAFNVADAAITTGATLIFLELLFASRRAPNSV